MRRIALLQDALQVFNQSLISRDFFPFWWTQRNDVGTKLGLRGPWRQNFDQTSLIDGLLVRGSDDGVTFPVAHLLVLLNVAWPLADRAAVGDLPAPVTPAQVAFAPRLLAAQVRV